MMLAIINNSTNHYNSDKSYWHIKASKDIENKTYLLNTITSNSPNPKFPNFSIMKVIKEIFKK